MYIIYVRLYEKACQMKNSTPWGLVSLNNHLFKYNCILSGLFPYLYFYMFNQWITRIEESSEDECLVRRIYDYTYYTRITPTSHQEAMQRTTAASKKHSGGISWPVQVKKFLRERESKASKASFLLHSSAGQDMFTERMTGDFQRLCFMENLQKRDAILVALSYALRTPSNVIYKLLAFHLIAGKPSRMIEKVAFCYEDCNNNAHLCRNSSSKSSSTSKETCGSNTYSFLQVLRQRVFNKCRTCCSLSTEATDLTPEILDYEYQPRRRLGLSKH